MRVAMSLVATLSLAATPLAAAPPASAEPGLQAMVDRFVADGYPGVIAYVRAGERIQRVTGGVSDLRTGQAVEASDRFRIASNTKSSRG